MYLCAQSARTNAKMPKQEQNKRNNINNLTHNKKTNEKTAFGIFDKDHDILIQMGSSDLIIKKEELKNSCYCLQSSFDYKGKQNTLIG